MLIYLEENTLPKYAVVLAITERRDLNSKVAKLVDEKTAASSLRQLGNMMVNYIHCCWLQGNTN